MLSAMQMISKSSVKSGQMQSSCSRLRNNCSGEVCHTPKELFDLLADDYRTYLEIELTKGKREVTEDDEREADALCKQYLERWKEEQK